LEEAELEDSDNEGRSTGKKVGRGCGGARKSIQVRHVAVALDADRSAARR
jgi:hypothetical protein